MAKAKIRQATTLNYGHLDDPGIVHSHGITG